MNNISANNSNKGNNLAYCWQIYRVVFLGKKVNTTNTVRKLVTIYWHDIRKRPANKNEDRE